MEVAFVCLQCNVVDAHTDALIMEISQLLRKTSSFWNSYSNLIFTITQSEAQDSGNVVSSAAIGQSEVLI